MKRYVMPALLALIAMPAMAHVTANPNQGSAGTYFQTSFRISHGCDGNATKEVRVKIPDGILTVRPQFKPGWKVETIRRKLDHEMPSGHGHMMQEAVTEVIWRGGPLPDDQYDEFGLVVKLPETAGQILWFPTTQICAGGKNQWAEIPADGQEWHELQRPAPFVTITPQAR